MNQRNLALLTAHTAEDKKAEDIVILEMEGISLIADYFIICHGHSEKQVQAIARGVKETLEEHDYDIRRTEGFDRGRWVLLDLEGVILHIFHKEERSQYQLEKLWGDAPVLDLEGNVK